MLPVNKSHEQYISFLKTAVKQLDENPLVSITDEDWELVKKFSVMDLSKLYDLALGTYTAKGPEPRNPSDMLRCCLVMLNVKTTSFTQWALDLKRTPIYAILSGFEPGNTPGVGTFYDFIDRLWLLASDNLSDNVKPKPLRPKKPKKGEKAEKPTKETVESLVEPFLNMPVPDCTDALPYQLLFDIFKTVFVDRSHELGLLSDTQDISTSGDGTPVVTYARPRYKKICDCKEKGIPHCDCDRFYSQPDCDTGWDSSRERFFNGYHMYTYTACGSFYDLPLMPFLYKASQHDSISLVKSLNVFSCAYKDYVFSRMLLDSAHDAMPIYRYLNHLGIQPFIDLNKRNSGNTKYNDEFTISPDGIPLCKKGLPMKDCGLDKKRGRRKFRCPLAADGVVNCDGNCSDSPYGRCVYFYTKDNPRFFPLIARDSDEWKEIYKRRTSSERTNKREKVDYMLEAGRHRSSKLWYFRIITIMMCQHLDAWSAEFDCDIKSVFAVA